MATTRNRRKQRLDQNLVRYQTALADAQARYEAVVTPKREQYERDVAAYDQTVAQQQREYDAQLQAYNARVAEFRAAQEANAAQRQSMLEAYQREVQDYNVRRADYEAEVLRIMEPYQAQLQAQQAAYANQMEDYNRAYEQYQSNLRSYDQFERGFIRDVSGNPVSFQYIGQSGQPAAAVEALGVEPLYLSEETDYQYGAHGRRTTRLVVGINDAVQFVETGVRQNPRMPFSNGEPTGTVTGYIKMKLPDGSFLPGAPGDYASVTSRPTFSAQAPTRPALTNAPALPEAPPAPASPQLPVFSMEMPSAPTLAAPPPAPSQPDFSAEELALQEEIARETEFYDREIAERQAGRRRARGSGGRRPVISMEQIRAAQQPNLSDGQSLGDTGFLGGN